MTSNKKDRRRCNICGCELYKDELGSYCQDCRGLLSRDHRDSGNQPYHEQYAREQEERVQAHIKRVWGKIEL